MFIIVKRNKKMNVKLEKKVLIIFLALLMLLLIPASFAADVNNDTTVNEVAINDAQTDFSVEDVKQIRNHVFKEEHDLGNGYKELFAPAADIAHAWQRLEQGNPTEIDKILLGHELTELTLIKKYGYSQEKAHLEADKLYPWEYKLKKGDLTDDDIQKDIRERLKNLLQS